jgi:hypothetical protein
VLLVPKLYKYIPLPNLKSDDVVTSRGNRNFSFTIFFIKSVVSHNDSANMATEEMYDALILSVDSPLNSWVMNSEASFHTTAICEVLENYVVGNFRKVYLVDGSVLDIVGMSDVHI